MHLKCEVKFDQNPHGIYFCGQIVSGSVEILIKEPNRYQGISFSISGNSQTMWEEDNPAAARDERRIQSITYTAKENYFYTKKYLENKEIGPGKYSYNFLYTLPTVLPSSFEGTHGHIRYMAKVSFERRWRNDQTYAVPFTVLKRVDLNYSLPQLRIPTEAEIIKEFCCGPCRTKPLIIKASVPQSGYVPGEIISIKIDVQNKSRVNIPFLLVSLRKTIKYESRIPCIKSHNEYMNIVEKYTDHVEHNSIKTFDEQIKIPPVPPTDTFPCKIIQINYEIRIEVKVLGIHSNPSATIPIIIGTIPLTSLIKTSLPLATNNKTWAKLVIGKLNKIGNTQPITNPIQDGMEQMCSSIQPLPPPSYEEAIYMKRTNLNDGEEPFIEATEFAPRYPVYNFGDDSNQPNTSIELPQTHLTIG